MQRKIRGRSITFLAEVCALLLLGVLAEGCAKKEAGEQWAIDRKYAKGPVEVHLKVSRRAITIAERITLELESVSKGEVEVEMPQFGEKLEQFGISDYSAPPPELLGEGLVRTRRRYSLEPFLSGEYRIPPMTVRFRERGPSAAPHEIATDEIAVTVKSLLPSQVQKLEIKDIAPPEEVPFPWGRAALWGGLAALALGGAGVSLWLRGRKARQEAAARIPAHVKAYAALDALLREDLLGRGEVKEFYNRVSGILRHYIEDRFGMRAPERTTEEFLAEMGQSSLLETSWKEILGRFLAHCDLVKFAEHLPGNPEIQATFDTCKDFIEATREREEGDS